MSIAKITRTFIKDLEEGKLFTYNDIPSNNKISISLELSRLFKKGLIKKLSKGKYYKPKIRSFGEIAPSSEETIQSFLEDTKGNNYETGYNSYLNLGLTSQVANVTIIASDKKAKKIKINNLNIKFVQKKLNVKKDDIYLLQILDALENIKKIPGTNVNDALLILKRIIKELSDKKQKLITKYSEEYAPRVRAILGAILKEFGKWELSYSIKSQLNPLTKYTLGISSKVLSNKKDWNII